MPWGLPYIALGKMEMAQSCFDDVLKNDADNMTARLLMGIVSYNQQAWDRAEKYLRGVLAIDRSNIEARYYAGMIGIQKNKPDEALKDFEELKSHAPKDPTGLVWSGNDLCEEK